MELIIKKEKADFNTSELGNSKLCLIIEFPNCISSKTGKPFKWLPSYSQIKQITKALEEIEQESWEK